MAVCVLILVLSSTKPCAGTSVFEECDADGDHSLTAAELSDCVGIAGSTTSSGRGSAGASDIRGDKRPMSKLPPGTSVEAFIRTMDRNRDGVVQWDEYLLAIRAVNGEGGFPKDRRMQGQGSPAAGAGGVGEDADESRGAFERYERLRDAWEEEGAASADSGPGFGAGAHRKSSSSKSRSNGQTEWFDDEDEGEDLGRESGTGTAADMDAHDAIELTLRDGTVRHISQQELFHTMDMSSREQARLHRQTAAGGAGMGAEKEEQEKEEDEENFVQEFHTLDRELHAEKPEVSHFTQLALWAVGRLKSRAWGLYPDSTVEEAAAVGHRRHVHMLPRFPAKARLLRLASLPVGGSPERERARAQSQAEAENSSTSTTSPSDQTTIGHIREKSSFTVSFEVAVQPGGQRRGQWHTQKAYEIQVRRDPAMYRYPHLAIEGCWELSSADGHGVRKQELQLPLVRRTRTRAGDVGTGLVGDIHHAWSVLAGTTVDVVALLVDTTTTAFSSYSNSNSNSNDAAASGSGPGQKENPNPNMVWIVIIGWTALGLAAVYALVLPLVFIVLQLLLPGAKAGDLGEGEHEHRD